MGVAVVCTVLEAGAAGWDGVVAGAGAAASTGAAAVSCAAAGAGDGIAVGAVTGTSGCVFPDPAAMPGSAVRATGMPDSGTAGVAGAAGVAGVAGVAGDVISAVGVLTATGTTGEAQLPGI